MTESGLAEDRKLEPLAPDDRRRWPRMAGRNRISLTVLSAPEAPTIEGRKYFCWTEDLSVGGLRFCVSSRVPLGAILKMDVRMEDGQNNSFVHIGRVVWEQESEDDAIVSRWLGVEITETVGGAERLRLWTQLVEGALAE